MVSRLVRLLTSRTFVFGFLGGVLATIALYLGTGLLGLPFPPEALFSLIIAPVPGAIQSVAVENLREYAKYSAFTFASIIYSILYALIAVAIGHFFAVKRHGGTPLALLAATLLPTAIGVGLEASLSSTVSTLSTISGWLMAGALILVVNCCYAVIAVRGPELELVKATAPREEVKPVAVSSRRGFLRKAFMAAAVLAIAGIVAQLGLSFLQNRPLVGSGTPIPVNSQTTETVQSTQTTGAGLPSVFSDPRIADLLNSEVTDNRIFYRVDINAIPPNLNFDIWSLNVHGKVNNPFRLDKAGLLSMPTSDEYATLECVSNTINPPGALISNAKWTGVPLSTILNQAGLAPDAKYVVFHCAEGYAVGIPLERALEKGALLAYMMNDQPLPQEHGFPMRAIIPGIYGMMNAKWISDIEVVDYVYVGYWQERGWSNDARVKTTSIFYYPQPGAQVSGTMPIAGVAFAGDRGISKVEVSTDGGQTWNDAVLKPPKSPYSWVLWAYEWTPNTKGTVTIIVRATDGTGQVQEPTATDAFPNGATGYSSMTVTAT